MQRDVAEFLNRREVFKSDGDYSSGGKPSAAYCQNKQPKREYEIWNHKKRGCCPGKRARVSALQIPKGSASAQAISVAVNVNSKVFRARAHNIGATGLL